MLKAGAEVDAQTDMGDTPLHWAVEGGHTEVVATLVDAGADILNGMRDHDSTTYALPLYRAAREGHTEIVEVLRDAEAERRAREEGRRRAEARFRDCPECPEMVEVPSGSFMMGSPSSEEGRSRNEGPRIV